METMLLVPVDDSVVFPTMTVTLAIDVGTEERVVLVPRKGDEFASVGTVAEIADHIRLPGGGRAVALEGSTGAGSALRARRRRQPARRGRPHPDDRRSTARTTSLSASIAPWSRSSSSSAATTAASPRSSARSSSRARWRDTAGYSPDLTYDHKIELLEILDVSERLGAPRPRR